MKARLLLGFVFALAQTLFLTGGATAQIASAPTPPPVAPFGYLPLVRR